MLYNNVPIKKKILVIVLSILLLVIVSAGSFYIGYNQGEDNPKITLIKGVSNMETDKETDIDFSLFWKSWNLLKEKYVDADKLNDQDLMYGAISGLFSATKDPYTVFMPPAQATDFNQEISGEFGGIGIEIGLKQNQLTVIAPLKDTPAAKAGLIAGDKIIKINDEITSSFTVEDAVNKIRGPKGTQIKLTIFRTGWNEPKEFALTRETIQVPTLDWKIVNDQGKEDKNGKIVYIQLYNFYEKAPYLFYQAALQSAFSDPKGIILDLRNNPGGYLEASINIAGWFLNKGDIVVKEKIHDGSEKDFTANGTAFYKDTPIVILINQGSASASEILAGALKDNRGVKLVGKKSFGKGSVQEIISEDESLAKITIAHWLTPKGTVIDKNGLTPDYDVDLTEDDIANSKDPQLDKALEILKSQIQN